MDNSDIQLIGSPCGQHGPYTFYKAFKYEKNGVKRIVQLSEFFFVKLWIDTDLLCIGELQLLWCDKNSEQILASLRLYFLPENTPEGRLDHGEDEVLAISEKVVLRVEDLITWITVDAEWTWGRLAKCEKDIKEAPDTEENRSTISNSLAESSLDFSDVDKEKKALIDHNTENDGPLVIILSYPRYCRYRAMMRRLEGVEDEYLKYKIVRALGGFTSYTKNTRVLFCKDTFDYPELEGHELLCNHLAPKLKGRPRGKRKKRSVSPGSESNESESSSVSNVIFPTITTEKIPTETSSCSSSSSNNNRNGLRCGDTTNLRRSTRSIDNNNNESKEFLKELYSFMKKNYTPIGKIPSLGYKEIDLYSFYKKVQKLGGYDLVTTNRLWKSIFDEMSGHQNSTSATTIIRRHYERFLLPYERHIKGEEHKPLPVSERRRLKSKNSNSNSGGGGSSGGSDVETSEGASSSRSGNSTPIPQSTTPITPVDNNKEFNIQMKIPESKTSSLRSVRVKPERQKDKSNEKLNNIEIIEKETDNIINIKTDKDNEPLTTAIAPIVIQKLPITVENCKEEAPPPIIETGDVPKSPPIQPPPPPLPPPPPPPPITTTTTTTSLEIIDLDKTTNLDDDASDEQNLKKDKLDILKEGGLDITPIRTFIKDVRPSVIQPTGVVVQQQQQMPPPPPPPPPPLIKSSQLPQALNVKQLTTNPANYNKKLPSYTMNGFINNSNNNNNSLPSKLLQSKSIYSYSLDKTVYGNPREFTFTTMNLSKKQPEIIQQSQQSRQNNCDILDLSLTNSRRKKLSSTSSSSSTTLPLPSSSSSSSSASSSSSIEIMRIPNLIGNNHKNHHHHHHHHHKQQQQQQQQQYQKLNHNSTTFNKQQAYNHLLDGRRLGSNVEITLVNNNNNNKSNSNNNNHNKVNIQPQITTNRYSQKRSSNDIYTNQKIPKLDENYKLSQSTHLYNNHNSSNNNNNNNNSLKNDYNSLMKVPLPQVPPIQIPQSKPTLPSYLSQLYDNGNNNNTTNNNNIVNNNNNNNSGKSLLPPPPPYLPFLDPFYYLYSHNNLNTPSIPPTVVPPPSSVPPTPPPILPFLSQEQLKFYSDLMVRNNNSSSTRLNFPFTINPNDHFKKS